MLRDGEAGPDGVAICVEDWRRDVARGSGEGGTELRSGMPVMKMVIVMVVEKSRSFWKKGRKYQLARLGTRV
jgi:hypothetical protein